MRHEVTYVEPVEHPNGRQINIRLRDEVEPGRYELTIRFGGAESAPAAFDLVSR